MNIQKLIKKVDSIKEEFDIINSRIAEFTSSTDKEILDFDLIKIFHKKLSAQKKYLEEYMDKIHKIATDPDTEAKYVWHINLFQTRLAILSQNISATLDRIQNLNKYRTIDPELKYNDITNHFFNSEHMDQIRKKLTNLNDLYKTYKEYQKKFNINLNLDDKIEKELESKSHEVYLDAENNYLIWANAIFHLLDKLKKTYKIEWEKALENYINTPQNSLIKKYNWDYIQNMEMDKKYILWLNIEKELIWTHLENLEKTVNKYIHHLNFLNTIHHTLWRKNINSLITRAKKIWLKTDIILDNFLLKTLDEQLSREHKTIEYWIKSITNIINLDKLNKYIQYYQLIDDLIWEYEELQYEESKKWKAKNMNFASIIQLISTSFYSNSKSKLLDKIKKSATNLKSDITKWVKGKSLDESIEILKKNLEKITSIKVDLLAAIKAIATFVYKSQTKEKAIETIKTIINENKYLKEKNSIISYLETIFKSQYSIKKSAYQKAKKMSNSTYSSSSSTSSSTRSSPSSRSSSSSRSGSSRSGSSSSRSGSSYSSSWSSSR